MNTLSLLFTGAVALFGVAIFIGIKVGTEKLPSAAAQQGYKNALIVFISVAAIYGLVWLIISWTFKQPAKDSFFTTGIMLWLVVYILAIIFWFINRNKAGKELLVLMPYPNKTLIVVLGVLCIIFSFVNTSRLFWRYFDYQLLISGIFYFTFGTYQILLSFQRMQIHENGIMAYLDLVPWEKIETFQWVNANKQMYTVKMKYKGRLPGFMREGALPVPLEKKAELEIILEKYLNKAIPLVENTTP